MNWPQGLTASSAVFQSMQGSSCASLRSMAGGMCTQIPGSHTQIVWTAPWMTWPYFADTVYYCSEEGAKINSISSCLQWPLSLCGRWESCVMVDLSGLFWLMFPSRLEPMASVDASGQSLSLTLHGQYHLATLCRLPVHSAQWLSRLF